MSLRASVVRATVAVTDLDRARAFYEGVLGLERLPGGPPFVAMYPCGEGSLLQVYASGRAGPSGATAASWSVPDHDAVIDALLAAGATLERYEGLEADERGVHAFGTHRVAWERDPDGNVLAIDNGEADY